MKKAIFFFFLFFYLLTASGHLYVFDETAMAFVTRSIVENKGFFIPEECSYLPPVILGKDGKFYVPCGLFQSILAIPFYILGKFISGFLKTGLHISFYFSLFNSFITSLTCLFFFLFSKKFYSIKTSLILTLFYGLGSMAWPYSRSFLNQPLTCLFILLAFYTSYLYKEKLLNSNLFLAGIFTGLSILTRIDNIIIIPALFLYLLLLFKEQRLKTHSLLARISLFFLPIIFSLLTIAIYNYIRFGSIFITGYGSMPVSFNNPFLIGVYGILFSSGVSIFFYNPILFLLPYSYGMFYRKRKDEAIFFGILFLLFLFAYSQWDAWYGGGTWGPRFMLPVILFLYIPIGDFIEGAKKLKKMAVLFLFFISILVQIVGISVNFETYFQLARKNYKTDVFIIFYPPASPIVGHTKICAYKLFGIKDKTKIIEEYKEPFDFWFINFIDKGISKKVVYPILIFLVLSIVCTGLWIFLKIQSCNSEITIKN